MKSATATSTNTYMRVAEAADRFTDEIKDGLSPSIEAYAEQYPEIADIILNIFPALAVLDDKNSTELADADTGAPVTGALGDFRILRELGRGGMGIVYEAEQISLGRRVALKVLPFAAMLDKQQLVRFKNEARAAATLDHPNIVAIYSVGTERGVHYYAMQLIEGQSLAEAVEELRKAEYGIRVVEAPRSAIQNPKSAIDTAPIAAHSTLPDFHSPEYFRAIARLGIQAADALDHAHQNGILHRDIKPANLMVDCAGKLWVTDFGLARIEQDAGMTMTGDMLGTLRYMSPEQACGQRAVVDHRTDIYSLGVTLYELLTLLPAFPCDDRQELLRQIAVDEPRKPRQVRLGAPQDLETIVLKAIEKNLADRYATAKELADDLRRFNASEPIHARPATQIQRAIKWSLRHMALVWSVTAVLLLSTLILGASSFRIAKWYREAEVNAEAARKSANESIAVINFLLNDLLAAPQSAHRLGTELTLNDVLTNAEAKISKAFINEPRLEAFVRENLARTFNAIEQFEKAERNAQRALDLRLTEDGVTPAEIRSATESLTKSIQGQGKRDEARHVCEAVIAHIQQNYGAKHRDAIILMGVRIKVIFASALLTKSEVRESLDLCKEYVQLCSEVFGVNDRTTLDARQLLSAWTSFWGSSDEAAAMNHELLEAARKSLGPQDALTHVLIRNEAVVYSQAQRHEEAAPLLEEALQGVLVDQGIRNETGIELMLQLASTYAKLGRHEDAGRIIDILVDASQQTYGPDHGRSMVHMLSLVSSVGYRRDIEQYRKVQDLILTWWETNHRVRELPDYTSKRYLACVLAIVDRTDEAKEVVDDMERTVAPADFLEWDQLAWFLATSPIDGVRDGERAVKIAQKACELSKYQEASPIDTLAAAYAEASDFDEAAKWSEKALEMAQDEPIRAARYTKHLKCFQSNKPWREE